MTSTGGDRPTRVGERIRQELMEMLLAGAVKDPGVRGAIVHAVQVSGDLQHARVYVRLGEPDPSPGRRRALMRGLSRARGFLRRQLGQRLQTRYTPDLTFEWDETAERAARIETLLDEIRTEREGDGGADA